MKMIKFLLNSQKYKMTKLNLLEKFLLLQIQIFYQIIKIINKLQ